MQDNKDIKEKKEHEIDEVADEIESALKDSRGINSHQKRLAICLSIGITDLLERYLKKKGVLKTGYKVDHRILKKKKENAKSALAEKITSPINSLDRIDHLLEIAYEIEGRRNALAYGGKVSDDVLRGLIDKYLDVKKEVEND